MEKMEGNFHGYYYADVHHRQTQQNNNEFDCAIVESHREKRAARPIGGMFLGILGQPIRNKLPQACKFIGNRRYAGV
jgi:hypothetical protein